MVQRTIKSIITGPDGNIYLECTANPLAGKGGVIKIQTHSKECNYKVGDQVWTNNSFDDSPERIIDPNTEYPRVSIPDAERKAWAENELKFWKGVYVDNK